MSKSWLEELNRNLKQCLHAESRFVTISSAELANDGSILPYTQTMVFRGFFQEGNRPILRFATDLLEGRSEKVGRLAKNSRSELCWYFGETKKQFRLKGRAFCIGNGGMVKTLEDGMRCRKGSDSDENENEGVNIVLPDEEKMDVRSMFRSPYVDPSQSERLCLSSGCPLWLAHACLGHEPFFHTLKDNQSCSNCSNSQLNRRFSRCMPREEMALSHQVVGLFVSDREGAWSVLSEHTKISFRSGVTGSCEMPKYTPTFSPRLMRKGISQPSLITLSDHMELFGKKLLCHLVISQEDIEQLLHSITPQIEELAPSTFLTLYFLPDMVDILKLSVTREIPNSRVSYTLGVDSTWSKKDQNPSGSLQQAKLVTL